MLSLLLLLASPMFFGLNQTTTSATLTAYSGQSLGTTRNNANIEVGVYITTTGARTLTQIGRWVVAGNSQTHVLIVRNAAGTSLGTVTVNCSGATAAQYLYGTLSSPISLSSGQNYYVMSTEVSGGDLWYDIDTTLSGSSDLTAWVSTWQGGYYSAGTPGQFGGPGTGYGPVNFKFTNP